MMHVDTGMQRGASILEKNDGVAACKHMDCSIRLQMVARRQLKASAHLISFSQVNQRFSIVGAHTRPPIGGEADHQVAAAISARRCLLARAAGLLLRWAGGGGAGGTSPACSRGVWKRPSTGERKEGMFASASGVERLAVQEHSCAHGKQSADCVTRVQAEWRHRTARLEL